jgi:hypothetical protein
MLHLTGDKMHLAEEFSPHIQYRKKQVIIKIGDNHETYK